VAMRASTSALPLVLAILLSAVLDRHRAAGDQAAIARLQKISPVAWQNILFLGRYLFRGPPSAHRGGGATLPPHPAAGQRS
jgi:hypothetical protein